MTVSTTPTATATTMLGSLRRSSFHNVLTTTSFGVTTASSASASYSDDSEHHNEPPINKELMEQYGTRLATAKASLASVTKRVANDRQEFANLQAGLRQGTGRGLLTDAWLKQNLMGLLHRHAKAMETRKAAAALQEVSTTTPKSTTTVAVATAGSSPTSIMQSLSLDSAQNFKEHVASPPLGGGKTTTVP